MNGDKLTLAGVTRAAAYRGYEVDCLNGGWVIRTRAGFIIGTIQPNGEYKASPGRGACIRSDLSLIAFNAENYHPSENK